MKPTAEKLFNFLRTLVPELNAIVVISTTGEFEVKAISGFEFDAETFAAEYAALFRIAHRTAEDTAMGDTFEQILISDKAILVVRRLGSDDLAVFVCAAGQSLGRLRYEIRRLAESVSDCAA